ncbi:single-strand DNA-binding protein [Spiroplasma sp. TIUS-1]|uniref:single-stranded DNA-binding protein n=1 Tax=Spiroplasma sp. TIUS-1 TaxID=216963 RepID=UPI001397B98E|nr:single-stranded DNA-binding protein [Spiroplasma sp. TIUS-1]QHX35576.1 single-strand DNA-binding protein [Spiroplasma sp. TIUS-1]
MNSVNLIGRITKDIEIKTTSNGKPYVQFTLAVDDFFGGERQTQFISCIAWNRQAENMARYLKKGSPIAAEGSINVRTENKNGQYTTYTSVNIAKITFLESSSGGSQSQVKGTNQTSSLNNYGYDLVEEKEESPKVNNDSILWED